VTANGADAVTVGDAIDFGDTAYQPESGWGRELIAHELAHVVQQRCLMARGSKQRLLVSSQAFAWSA
jgi:hypothetical protein